MSCPCCEGRFERPFSFVFSYVYHTFTVNINYIFMRKQFILSLAVLLPLFAFDYEGR